jgi:hypothetical protein
VAQQSTLAVNFGRQARQRWLAVIGRTRLAIGALAALVLLDWMLQDVWSIPFLGLEPSLDRRCRFRGSTARGLKNSFSLVKGHGVRRRFGSFCDIGAAPADVRFVPCSGRITRSQLTSAKCQKRKSAGRPG